MTKDELMKIQENTMLTIAQNNSIEKMYITVKSIKYRDGKFYIRDKTVHKFTTSNQLDCYHFTKPYIFTEKDATCRISLTDKKTKEKVLKAWAKNNNQIFTFN